MRCLRRLLPLLTLVVQGSCSPAPDTPADQLLVLHGSGIESTLELVPWEGNGSGRRLSDGLIRVTAPSVSPDGSRIAFAASTSGSAASSVFLVWQEDLRRELLAEVPGQVTGTAFLTDGAVVFAAAEANDPTRQDLFRIASGDPAPTRLTCSASSMWGPVLLKDGRLLFARHSLGTAADRLLVVHPDGTGLVPYAELPERSGRVQSLAADDHGDLHVLTRDEQGASLLWRVDADLPVHVGTTLEPLPVARAFSVDLTPQGTHLLASSEGVTLAGDDETRVVWRAPAGHAALYALSTAPRARPSPHLSLVDPAKNSAELFCIDVQRSRIPTVRDAPEGRIARARILGPAGEVLVDVPVFADGSFAAQVPADVPLQVELRDGHGQLLAAESHSFHMRPGERRGCIGCHESRLTAAPNQMPEALRVTAPAPQPATGGDVARKEQP